MFGGPQTAWGELLWLLTFLLGWNGERDAILPYLAALEVTFARHLSSCKTLALLSRSPNHSAGPTLGACLSPSLRCGIPRPTPVLRMRLNPRPATWLLLWWQADNIAHMPSPFPAYQPDPSSKKETHHKPREMEIYFYIDIVKTAVSLELWKTLSCVASVNLFHIPGFLQMKKLVDTEVN